MQCDEGDVWSPSDAVIEQAAQMCSGIKSVLIPEGVFIQISFGQPHFRKRFLMVRSPLERYAIHYHALTVLYVFHREKDMKARSVVLTAGTISTTTSVSFSPFARRNCVHSHPWLLL